MLIGYLRTSTIEQENGITAQRNQLTAIGVEKFFTDQGVSGGNFANRPAFAQMMSELRDGDTVCVTKLDRFGRTTRGILTLVDEFKERGIALRSLDGIDTSSDNPINQVVLTILASFAELERSLIRSRTKEALAAKFPTGRPRGLRGGRPPALTPKKDELIRREYDGGSTAKAVAELMSVSEATVWRSLARTAKGLVNA